MQLTVQLPPDKPVRVWNSGQTIVQIYFVPKEIPLIWKPNDMINESKTPDVFTSIEPDQELSEFEQSMMELVREGLATEEYVQDVFQQEQIFKDNFDRINKEQPNMAIVVCGGEIFVGDSLEELERQAAEKYPNRPPYSYSPTTEF